MKPVERFQNERGFTLIELMLSTMLMGILFMAVWNIFGHCFIFWKQAENSVDVYYSLRISHDRMGRELRYARGISISSDTANLEFLNADGMNVKYYCNLNELIRRVKGVSSPLASDIESVRFIYTTAAGLVIDESNMTAYKLLPDWAATVNLVTITIAAKKQGGTAGPVVLTQKVRLRSLP
ncbi:MAG: hypothetical protein A4E55_01457 [Pelotomaculum sp. PtaU1.Bin035]|nr:MAG: hypothetical protein A4E55_01457 [Pelotomaculum sp. PtaU1.Bin035]